MAQFYFLSILLNFLLGLILVYGMNFISNGTDLVAKDLDDSKKSKSKKNSKTENEKIEDEKSASPVKKYIESLTGLNSKTFRLAVGILGLLVGLMKILSVFRNDVPVIGDLFPAACGMLASVAVLIEYYMASVNSEIDLNPNVKKIFIDGRRYLGIACCASSVLHFVFPQVMLL